MQAVTAGIGASLQFPGACGIGIDERITQRGLHVARDGRDVALRSFRVAVRCFGVTVRSVGLVSLVRRLVLLGGAFVPRPAHTGRGTRSWFLANHPRSPCAGECRRCSSSPASGT